MKFFNSPMPTNVHQSVISIELSSTYSCVFHQGFRVSVCTYSSLTVVVFWASYT